jgi:DeoR/GlpR family transcriptional regulator of sugar metabolism
MAVATIELAMIRRTRGEVVVLADSSKIGLVGPLVICPLDQIDVVLVDDGIDLAVVKQIQRAGPQCEVVPA